MKKFIALLLAGLMLVSALGGCAGGSSAPDPASGQKQAETSSEKSEAAESKAQETSEQASVPEEASEEAPEESSEPEELGDFEYRFLTIYPEEYEIGAALKAYCDAVETATDGHVKFIYERIQDPAMMDSAIDFGDAFGMMSGFNAVKRYMYYHQASEEEYKKILDAPNYESLILPEVVTLPLQGFDDGVAMTNVLWDLYEKDSAYASLIDEFYKPLIVFVSSPLYYADERLTPDVDVFQPERDVRGGAFIYLVCCTNDLWERLPAAYQEKIEAVSGREISLTFAQMFKDSRDQNAEEWAVSLPESWHGQYVLLNPENDNYADYQNYFDAFTADWIKDAAEVTEVDAEAFLAKVKEMYAAEASK